MKYESCDHLFVTEGVGGKLVSVASLLLHHRAVHISLAVSLLVFQICLNDFLFPLIISAEISCFTDVSSEVMGQLIYEICFLQPKECIALFWLFYYIRYILQKSPKVGHF